jgi:hypothetical protein
VLINPPDFHQILDNIFKYGWTCLIPSALNGRRLKARVSGFFSVLSHIRNEYRQFMKGD